MGYAYNDDVAPSDPRSTAYDREFALFESEIFAEGHYRDAHIQVTDWTDFKASFWALNGRTYPDTLEDNAPHNASRGYDPAASGGRLQYQPQSALVTAEAGDRVLLRLANLGYQTHIMTADNIGFTVVGRDASLLRDQVGGAAGSTDPANYAYNYASTNQLEIAPGESMDAIFTAPAKSPNGAYDSYLLYDRNYAYASNGGAASKPGGMVTEIRIYAKGALGVQQYPNQINPKVA
jgi:FtsP/CotA-like multicopper oxidase with cupredoxin domain